MSKYIILYTKKYLLTKKEKTHTRSIPNWNLNRLHYNLEAYDALTKLMINFFMFGLDAWLIQAPNHRQIRILYQKITGLSLVCIILF